MAAVLDRHPVLKLLGWTPWPEQLPVMQSNARSILVTGGEQSGKSDMAAKMALCRWFDRLVKIQKGLIAPPKEPDVIWLVAQEYNLLRKEYQYLMSDLAKMGLLDAARSTMRWDAPGRIYTQRDKEYPGLAIESKTANEPKTLASDRPIGILGCEIGQSPYVVYERLFGRTAQHGSEGWLIMTGTIEESVGALGWFPALAAAWANGTPAGEQSFSVPSWANRTIYPGGRDDPEIKRMELGMSKERFLERLAAVPSPPKGAVFGSYFTPVAHIRSECRYVPGLPVSIAIDPGTIGAYAVLAVQLVNGQVWVVDELYERDKDTEQMIELVSEPGRYPWVGDIDGSASIIDIAGTYRQGAARPVADLWNARLRIRLSAVKVPISEGVERMKTVLRVNPTTGRPGIIISPLCKGLISELGGGPDPLDPHGAIHVYSNKVDKDGEPYGNLPEDRYNHAIKALTYWLVYKYGYAYGSPSRRQEECIVIGGR